MKGRGGRYIKIGNPYKSEARLDTKESIVQKESQNQDFPNKVKVTNGGEGQILSSRESRTRRYRAFSNNYQNG